MNPSSSSTTSMKTWLIKRFSGRVLLHLACLLRDGKVQWHWAGMKRELRTLISRSGTTT
jgi:hypothetical protein